MRQPACLQNSKEGCDGIWHGSQFFDPRSAYLGHVLFDEAGLGLVKKPYSKTTMRYLLNDSISQHGVCHLDKTGQIRPFHIVGVPIFLPVLKALCMDAFHDVF